MTSAVIELIGRDRLPSGHPAVVLEQPTLALGQRPRRVHCSVAQFVERLGAHIGDVIARLVVTGVVRLTGGAAVDSRLLRGLDALGPAEQATGGNTGRDEGAVVRPAIKCGRLGRQTLTFEVAVEDLLDLRGSGR